MRRCCSWVFLPCCPPWGLACFDMVPPIVPGAFPRPYARAHASDDCPFLLLPPETALLRRRPLSAGGFFTLKGALAFSYDAPGPPCRIVGGIFLEVDTWVS